MDTTHRSAPVEDWLRAAVRPLVSRRGGTILLYHLLGLPLGIAYFVWLVTGLSTGLGLLVTLIGIPLLTLVLASVRPLAAAERFLANELLGAGIPGAPLAPSGSGWIGRLTAYWSDGRTWRGVAFLFVRFPAGLASFVVATVAYGVALMLLAAPVLAPLDADGLDVGPWAIDGILEGLALMPLGAIALIAAGWISVAMGALSVELARWGTR
jgi:Flp pilus assembly protein TadB